MKALFKRNSPPPAPIQPAMPFPYLYASKEGILSSMTHFRPRGFSFSKEALSTPPKTISAPILQVKPSFPSSPEAYTTARRRLQSGGITFEEVLPLSSVPSVPALPCSHPILDIPATLPSVPRNHQATALTMKLSPIRTDQDFIIPDDHLSGIPPSPSTPGTHGSSPRQPIYRYRRGTNEVGTYTAHIDGLVSPTILSQRGMADSLPRPKVMIRRATSLDNVRAYPSSAPSAPSVKPTLEAPASPSPLATSQQSRNSDQTGLAACTSLLESPEITSRPRATSTSVMGRPPPRRPALSRAVEMHTSKHPFRHVINNGSDLQRTLGMEHVQEDDLARSSLPSGTKKAAITKPVVSTGSRQSIAIPLLNSVDVFNPTYTGPRTPTSMFSVYPDYARDTNIKIPFPTAPASPRTVLTPPTNPQIGMALHVDATRISLGRYEIDQDLTFSIRVQNSVTDDVEVELVRVEEGLETVYELKIRKKDPHGMRVRNGIVPYTYVPPFSSASSSSVCSSLCSSPVTTPPLEVPPFHHYGSYFPPQYVCGGTWRTPRRGSHVNKGTRSSKSSSATVTTPLVTVRQSLQSITVNSGRNGVVSHIPKASPVASSGSRYDSDADDDNDDDNTSFLLHYAPRGALLVPTPTPSSGMQAVMHPDHDLYGKSAFTTDDDTAEEDESSGQSKGASVKDNCRESCWSDTEPEVEVEVADGLETSLSKGLLETSV